jgi:hypothetical protein
MLELKSQCKEVENSGICEHGEQKYRCKDCGEATYVNIASRRVDTEVAYVKHGRQMKSRYKKCGGQRAYAEHGGQKSRNARSAEQY